MKKIIFFVLVFNITSIGYSQPDFGTSCWDKVRTITTDWRRCSEDDNGVPNGDSPNNWDWTKQEFTICLKYNNAQCTPTTVLSPFWRKYRVTTNQPNTYGLQNVDEFGKESRSTKDFHPEDGWELVTKNFSDTCGTDCSMGQTFAFFVLYNRYSGKIRVFLLSGTVDLDGQKVFVKMKQDQTELSDRITALFAHSSATLSSVKSFQQPLQAFTANHYQPDNLMWFYGEFDMAYDPCTCFFPDKTKSSVVFDFAMIKETDITLKGEGVINQVFAKDDNITLGKTTGVYQNFNPGQMIQKGYSGYQTFEGFQKSANAFIDGKHEAFREDIAKKWIAHKKANGVFPVFSPGHPRAGQTIQDYADLKSSGLNKAYGFTDLKRSDKWIKDATNVASALPYIGAAYGLVEYFTGFGANESVQPTPMNFEVNLNFTGKLLEQGPRGEYRIFTPGIKATSDLTPLYNNILGVFHIIESPKLKYWDYTYFPHASDPTNRDGQVKYRQYALANNIKYVINPHSNLEIEGIDAAFIIEYKTGFHRISSLQDALGVGGMPTSVQYPLENDWYVEHSLFRPQLTASHPKSAEEIFFDRMDEIGLEVESMEAETPPHGTLRLRTRYCPLECLRKQSFFLRGGSSLPMPKVFVKLIIKAKKANSPGADPILMVRTYSIDDYLELSGSFESTYDQVPDEYWETQLNIPQNPEMPHAYASIFPHHNVLNISGNFVPNYTTARVVNINSGALFSHGAVIAAREINISPALNLVPEIELRTPLLASAFKPECVGKITDHKATASDVSDVCNSGQYKNSATVFSYSPTKPYSKDSTLLNSPNECFLGLASPNPTSERVTITFNLCQEDNVKLSLFDVTGNQVLVLMDGVRLEKGFYSKSFQLGYLSSGVYFYTLEAGDFKQTKRLLIAR